MWARGTRASFPDLCDSLQFYVILANVVYFKEFLIHDSRGFMI